VRETKPATDQANNPAQAKQSQAKDANCRLCKQRREREKNLKAVKDRAHTNHNHEWAQFPVSHHHNLSISLWRNWRKREKNKRKCLKSDGGRERRKS
jgi:hypothetical protein